MVNSEEIIVFHKWLEKKGIRKPLSQAERKEIVKSVSVFTKKYFKKKGQLSFRLSIIISLLWVLKKVIPGISFLQVSSMEEITRTLTFFITLFFLWYIR